MALTSPEFSFIQFDNEFEPDDCIKSIAECLPVFSLDDLSFQLKGDEAAEYIVKVCTSCGYGSVNTEVGTLTGYQYGDDEYVYLSSLDSSLFPEDINVTDCFRLCLYKVTGGSYYIFDQKSYDCFGAEINIQCDADPITYNTETNCDLTDIQDLIDWLNTLGLGLFTYSGTHIFAPTMDEGCDITSINLASRDDPAYQLEFQEGEQTETYESCSNCFQLIDDKCFTSVLKYRSNENGMDFIYNDASFSTGYTNELASFYNQIRFALFYQNMQPKVTRKVFRLSDGSYKKLSALIEKEYEAKVEWINEDWHTKLVTAFEHDDMQIKQHHETGFTGLVLSDGDYKIGWVNEPGFNTDLAPASFLLKKNPFFDVNSNCNNDE